MLELLLVYVPNEDHPQFTEIYDKYCNLVRYISFLHLGKKQDIEDNVQETFLILAKNFDEVKIKDEKELKGFISLVAQRSAISVYRKRQNDENKSAIYVENMSKEISDDTFDMFNAIDIRRAMDKLPEADRTILMYRFVKQMTGKEMSEILGISTDNVRKRVERAKIKLRNILVNEDIY